MIFVRKFKRLRLGMHRATGFDMRPEATSLKKVNLFFSFYLASKIQTHFFSFRYICHMKHFCSLNVHAIVRYFFLVTAWCDDWMREVVLLSKTRYVIFAIVIRRMYLLSREVEPAQPWIQLSSWQIMWKWRKKGLSKDSLREACFFAMAGRRDDE